MYVRVTTLQWQSGQRIEAMDEAVRIVEESILPVSKQQAGFKGFLTLLDRRGGKLLLLTIWETEAALKANESSGYYREQIAKFAHLSQLYVTPPYRDVYELIMQEWT
jgi:heme-degrading monooxygenase HmoA